jgi:uncharacterized OB-fold protein
VDLRAALYVAGTASRRRGDPESGRLAGSRCADCGVPSWPGRAVCHQCGSPHVREEVFSPSGMLITHTMVYVSRQGLDAPYMLGQVALDDGGPLVFAQIRGLDAGAAVPCPVRVVIGAAGSTPWYWFEAPQS